MNIFFKLAILSLITVSVFAAQIIKVKVPLKDQTIYKVVYQSIDTFLNYDGEEISGGLDGELGKPTIVEITKNGSETLELVVESTAFFFGVDYDFGDPVYEEYTTCKSRLKKVNGKYSLKNTVSTCNFDPAVEVEEPKQDPCCEEGRPVVDSNYCFDYYEEGAEYCAQYSDTDIDYDW